MSWFDWSRSTDEAPDEAPDEVSDEVPSPDQERALELFGYAGCGYSARVERALQRMPGLAVSALDVRRDREAAARLRRVTGRSTVPCLFVDGEPLFESADIIRWLERHHRWRTARAQS